MDQDEVADARRDLEAELADLLGQSTPAISRCAGASSRHAPASAIAATPAAIDGALTLNGPRMRLSASTTCAGAVEPAEPQRREAVDLREGARHHDVLGGRDQLDAGLVVVAPHVFGISRVEHEQHVLRQPRVQALHLVERNVGAGRVVRVRQEDDLGALGVTAREDRIDVGGVIPSRARPRVSRRRRASRSDRPESRAWCGSPRRRPDVGVREQVEQFVGAGAAHDPVRDRAHSVWPIASRSSVARAVRIVLQMVRRPRCRPRSPSGSGRAASRWRRA